MSVQIAREQYRPGWSAGLEYRKRFGDNPGGDDRADMMAAMLTVDLPLFPKQRQDRRLSASIQQAASIQLTRDDKLRELLEQLSRAAGPSGATLRTTELPQSNPPLRQRKATISLKTSSTRPSPGCAACTP